eukprot:CAMPEP_0183543056 /NCGR_PEP_ID=MMETSP0371-20130417/43102_1 /TAXON_ID=268820 /ORGANISM="Peridinium aciculiferum, Strain PAER-2" /LENGTH=38 /DNA_ID= /DNA_START= /DNA_END= /DNA_ORIENTATION=
MEAWLLLDVIEVVLLVELVLLGVVLLYFVLVLLVRVLR